MNAQNGVSVNNYARIQKVLILAVVLQVLYYKDSINVEPNNILV